MGDSPEQQPDAPQEQGVTLDGLSAAYAKSLGASADSEAPPVEPEDGSQPAVAPAEPAGGGGATRASLPLAINAPPPETQSPPPGDCLPA